MARRTVSYKAPSGWSKRIDIDYGDDQAPKGWDKDGDGIPDSTTMMGQQTQSGMRLGRPLGYSGVAPENTLVGNQWMQGGATWAGRELAGVSPIGANPLLATESRTASPVQTNARTVGSSRPVAGPNPYGVGTWFPDAQRMTVNDRRLGGDELTSPSLQGGVPLTENLEEQRQAAKANQAAASGPKYAPPPSWAAKLRGFDPNWWNEFQAATHRLGTEDVKGVTPIDFYLPAAGGDEQQALQLALTDKAWGEQFYATYGRAPTDDDWRFHWFAQRGGVPGQQPAQQNAMTDLQSWAQFPSGQSQPYASPGPIYR